MPDKTQRAVDLACEKGASNWLTVIPLKDMDFDLNKREFRDTVRLRYDWPIPDNPSVCVYGSLFTLDHAMICLRGGLVIRATMRYAIYRPSCLTLLVTMGKLNQHYNLLQAKSLPEGLTKPFDARLDVHCRGFWERQRAAFNFSI